MHCKCKYGPTFGALSNQGLCHLCSAANTTENLSQINLERKNQIFWFMEKHLSYNFRLTFFELLFGLCFVQKLNNQRSLPCMKTRILKSRNHTGEPHLQDF